VQTFGCAAKKKSLKAMLFRAPEAPEKASLSKKTPPSPQAAGLDEL
jgi:hypothetical protein